MTRTGEGHIGGLDNKNKSIILLYFFSRRVSVMSTEAEATGIAKVESSSDNARSSY